VLWWPAWKMGPVRSTSDLVAGDVDGEDGGDGLAGVGVDQERGQQAAGEGGVDLLERLAVEPHRGADVWLLGRGQQGGDAGVGSTAVRVSEPYFDGLAVWKSSEKGSWM